MFLVLQDLQDRYLHQIVRDGDVTEFRRIANEADDRLLGIGKWVWTRESLQLVPDQGIITLPEGFDAIAGARYKNRSLVIHSREYPFSQGVSTKITVDPPGDHSLHDRGWHKETGSPSKITIVGMIVPNVAGDHLYIGELDGRPAFSTNGTNVPAVAGLWSIISWTTSEWTIQIYNNGFLSGIWSGPYDVASPDLVPSWDDTFGVSGDIDDILLAYNLDIPVRTYLMQGGRDIVEAVDCLVAKAPVKLQSVTDYVHCPNPEAIKLAMLSVVYEEANDIERSVAFLQNAVSLLDGREIGFRGGAKAFFKNRLQHPLRSQTRQNFL